MTHCQSGVERGISKGGNPIEVMGLLLGRPDIDEINTLIVKDVFPLPIEGFETRVIADDQDVINYMITLGERLEKTRLEKFMGWYHSHPFDVGTYSHCFLSQTDICTQLQWQKAEDPHGNPFLAIVVDPLRSLAMKIPEIKAFRAYPTNYNSPVINECPDGSIIHDERTRFEKWGSCWGRYYELNVRYIINRHSRSVIKLLTKNFLWMRAFASTTIPNIELKQRIGLNAKKLEKVEFSNISTFHNPGIETFSTVDSSSFVEKNVTENLKFEKICQNIVDLARENVHSNIIQISKQNMFLS